jgi:hypothetical protein
MGRNLFLRREPEGLNFHNRKRAKPCLRIERAKRYAQQGTILENHHALTIPVIMP